MLDVMRLAKTIDSDHRFLSVWIQGCPAYCEILLQITWVWEITYISFIRICSKLHILSLTSLCYRPQTKFAKVMFLHMSVSHSVHRGRWYPTMPCSRSPGGVSLHALQVSRSTSKGELEGSGLGGSPGPHPGGIWGVWPGGSLGPHPGGIPACTEADPPTSWQWLQWVVCILLECILVVITLDPLKMMVYSDRAWMGPGLGTGPGPVLC